MNKAPVLHPFLFAAFPILALYAHNMGEVSLSETLLPLLIALSSSLGLLVLTWVALRDLKKAGILVSMLVVGFLVYGHVKTVLGWYLPWLVQALPYIWAALFVASAYLTLRVRRSLHHPSNILNVAAVCLVVVSSATIAVNEIKRLGSGPDNWDPGMPVQLEAVEPPPDIYYIILDSYTDSAHLKETYSYDNSDFDSSLTDRGFYLASESRSNYTLTYLSLASSLNMDYVDVLMGQVDSTSRDMSLPAQMIRHSRVVTLLKSLGYKYIHFETWWGPTRYNEYADLNLNGGYLSEFNKMLIDKSVLGLFGIGGVDYRGHVLGAFDRLAGAAAIQGPKFVFAHIICPHWPYVFDADGNPIEIKSPVGDPHQAKKWLGQVEFVNKKVIMLVDELLSKSCTPPIIILQGDHGPRFAGAIEVDEPTDQQARDAVGILNALYLPNGGASSIYESITPVNTFRTIFNFYFGADFELLTDRSYFSTLVEPYRFIDVTDRLR